MESRFTTIQKVISERISNLPPIKHPPNKEANFLDSLVITVDSSKKGDWMQPAQLKIKQTGIGIVVRKGLYSLSGQYESFPFLVEIIEIPVLNRGAQGSQLTAEMAMETITEGVRNWAPNEWTGQCEGISVNGKEGTSQLTYAVRFKVRAYVKERQRAL